jgi:hypothetical protein
MSARPFADPQALLLAQVRALYRQRQALPCRERPESFGGRLGPACLAIEAEIRAVAERYRATAGWTSVSPPLPPENQFPRRASS